MNRLLNRRSALTSSLAFGSTLLPASPALAMLGAPATKGDRRKLRPRISVARLSALGLYFPTPAYTSTTAPHAISRAVLSEVTASLRPPLFLKRIEQNFARMDAARAERFMQSLQEREWALLAQQYANACHLRPTHVPQLANILALNFTAEQLGRISRYFGFAPIYTAISRYVPSKTSEFQAFSNPDYIAPLPQTGSHLTSRRVISASTNNAGVPPLGPLAPYVQWADYATRDIYLTFRTAPATGLLSVTSSVAATIAVYGFAASLAWDFGYGFLGGPIAEFIQWVSPSLWEDIGGTINQIIENWGIDLSSTSDPDMQVAYSGEFEGLIADSLGMSFSEQQFLQETGGDYGSFAPWSYELFDYAGESWESVSSQWFPSQNNCELVYCPWWP